MAIEQGIYTCVKVRRDNGSTGFGFYNLTKGMEQLCANSPLLSGLTRNYTAPRNQEVWMTAEAGEDFDKIETEKIMQHHPVTFSYEFVEVQGVKKAVFTYGKNAGRDIAGVRPGNVIIKTTAADIEDVKEYPFMYYGSPEIFTDYDRSFFVNAPGDSVEPNMSSPAELTAGGKITEADVLKFINAEPERMEKLLDMFQFVIDYNESTQDTRQIMVCDKKDNIIWWIAAISLIFPVECAKNFTFTTYSFLGDVDKITPIYENTMFCGVYSAKLNGDDEPSKDNTNYDLTIESPRSDRAVFDFSADYFTDSDNRYRSFNMLIESSFRTQLQGLKAYQKFIREKTSYKGLDNDYARGYSYYVLSSQTTEANLRYLDDAEIFADKYMDQNALSELLNKLFAVTIDKGEAGTKFDSIISFAEKVISKGRAMEGGITKNDVCIKYLSFLRDQFLSEAAKRDDYFNYKEKIEAFFKQMGVNFEGSFLRSIGTDNLTKLAQGNGKKWKLFEAAGLLGSQLNKEKDDKKLYSSDSNATHFVSIMSKLIECSEDQRNAILSEFSGVFTTIPQKVAFADSIFQKLNSNEAASKDITAYLVDKTISTEQEEMKQYITVVSKRLMCDSFAEGIIDAVREKNDYDLANKVFYAMLNESCSGRFNKYTSRIGDVLRELADTNNDQALGNIYGTFLFYKSHNILTSEIQSDFIGRYKKSIYSDGKWYSMPKETCDQLMGMIDKNNVNVVFADHEITNAILMSMVNNTAEHLDNEQSIYNRAFYNNIKIDFDIIRVTDKEACIDKIADALCRRSIAQRSSLIHYENFIQIAPHIKAHDQILEEWLRQVIKNSPKNIAAELIANIIVTMRCNGKTSIEMMGDILVEGKVKLRDITEALDDEILRDRLRQSGFNSPLGEMKRIIDGITAVYDAKEQGTIKGFFKGLFGNKKNKE